MKFIMLAAVVLFPGLLMAQVVKASGQPPWLGLTACNKRLSDPFSVQVNPASLAFVQKAVVGICSEAKYLQTDLRFFYGAAVLPAQAGGASLNIAYAGTDGYSQAKIGLAYAKKLGARLSLGIGFNYHRLSVTGYGSRSTVTASLGCQFLLSEKLNVFFATDNPAGGRLGKISGEKLGSVYSAGIGNILSAKVFVSAIIRKEEESPARIYFLVNYALKTNFTFFAGLSVSNTEGFFGSSILIRNFELKQVVGWKQGPGVTPSIVVIFHQNKLE